MPYALKHNGTVYYYITNLQGDVIQIVNANGDTVYIGGIGTGLEIDSNTGKM